MAKIKWYGSSTNGIWKRRFSADSMEDLYYKCLGSDVIDIYDCDPREKYIIEKAGFDYDEINDMISDKLLEDGGDYENELLAWMQANGVDDNLTDADWFSIIANQRGNAYNQTFEDENGEPIEFGADGMIISR